MNTQNIKLTCVSTQYKVNESKNTVVAIQKFQFPILKSGHFGYTSFITTGIARCNAKDNFNETIGKKLARAKSEKAAFIYFRNALNEKFKALTEEMQIIHNKLATVNGYIRHQKEYIHSFD